LSTRRGRHHRRLDLLDQARIYGMAGQIHPHDASGNRDGRANGGDPAIMREHRAAFDHFARRRDGADVRQGVIRRGWCRRCAGVRRLSERSRECDRKRDRKRQEMHPSHVVRPVGAK